MRELENLMSQPASRPSTHLPVEDSRIGLRSLLHNEALGTWPRQPPLLRALAVLLVLQTATHAEPYLAVQYGLKCSQCHYNPTGGGKRNSFGTIFAQTKLPSKVLSATDLGSFLGLRESDSKDENGTADSSAGSTFYSGYPTSFLSLGGDFRFNYQSTFGPNGSANSFRISEGQLYGSLEFYEGAISLYLDETVAPGGATAREAFGLLRGPWESYLKAGRILLPYGLRLQDDSAFIREITGFNFGVQDLGVELGLEPGPWSISTAVSNGSQGSADDNKDKQVTGMASFIQRHWRLGTQASWNNTSAARRVAVGGFAGVNIGQVSLLGEIDYLMDYLESLPGDPRVSQLLLYGAVNYQLFKGVNLRFAYDFADPDTTVSEDSFIRVSTGVQWFPIQFVEIRAFYRFRDDTETSLLDDESMLDFELHLFF